MTATSGGGASELSAVLAVLPVLAGLAAALAVLAGVPPPPNTTVRGPVAGSAARRSPPGPDPGTLHRYRAAVTALAALGVGVLVGGPAGVLLGTVAAVVTWTVIGRSEPAYLRRRRELVLRDLPQVVALLAAALRAGAAVPEATRVVAGALPGAAAQRLAGLQARLAVGVDPVVVWSGLIDDPELAPLGRALARAHQSGASVVAAVEQLADELADRVRAEAEDRARAVGVRAAVPLGLCLLPAFVLIGIVPLVAGLATSLAW